jgi:hypothetical protein
MSLVPIFSVFCIDSRYDELTADYFNPYSVLKPPGGFLDFLKITYLFIIY